LCGDCFPQRAPLVKIWLFHRTLQFVNGLFYESYVTQEGGLIFPSKRPAAKKYLYYPRSDANIFFLSSVQSFQAEAPRMAWELG
jgi:hypothetical protein